MIQLAKHSKYLKFSTLTLKFNRYMSISEKEVRHPEVDGPKLGPLHSYKIFLEEGEEKLICSCGLSKDQPFCDNSHVGTKFEPILFKAPQSRIYGFCLCKYSYKMPICDGQHKLFPGYVPKPKTPPAQT